MSATSTSIDEILHRTIGCWNAGDLDGYLDLYDERVKLHGYSPEPLDKAGVVSRYRMVWKALAAQGTPNPKLDVKEVFSTGHRLVCRFVMSGIHQGSFLGFPATGRNYEQQGITIMHFEGDRVIERWSITDRLGVLSQIGAFTQPGA